MRALLAIWIGLITSALVVALQAIAVASFGFHAYTLWWKAGLPAVTAGIPGSALMLSLSTTAIAYCLWVRHRIPELRAMTRHAALAISLLGSAGIVTFGGMVFGGLVQLVHR